MTCFIWSLDLQCMVMERLIVRCLLVCSMLVCKAWLLHASVPSVVEMVTKRKKQNVLSLAAHIGNAPSIIFRYPTKAC
jgi:hypothetical protein